MEQENIKLNELIKKKRKEKGFSQIELAKKIGTTQAIISNFENRKAGINSKLLELIFNELDIKIEKENN